LPTKTTLTVAGVDSLPKAVVAARRRASSSAGTYAISGFGAGLSKL